MVPSGLTSTGWPAVRDRCAELGVTFDPWQDGVGRIILSKRDDGTYATSIGGVVISIPRQVGKTFLFGAVAFALCLLVPGLTVIWTAHRLRTATETFSSMQGFARRRKIAAHVEQIFRGSGEEEIRFRNGSRILFGARERGFGRGFAKVDVLVFDEAQILTENAIDDMVPATNQAANPLLLFSGTPPKPGDPSDVFASKRARALTGASDDMAYVEFSADPDAKPDDRKQWAKANPSYPRRTPAQAILRMQENLTVDSFLREALGIWPASVESVIPLDRWVLTEDPKASFEQITGPPVFAVDVTPDKAWTSIAVAGLRADGRPYVELIEHQRGTRWAPAHLVELKKVCGGKVVAALGGPAGSLEAECRQLGLELEAVSASEEARACGYLYDAVVEVRLVRRHEPVLDVALSGAVKRNVGDGAWSWSRKNSQTVISPLVAVTLALSAAGGTTVGGGGFVDLNDFLDE